MRRLGHLTYREYANVVMFVIRQREFERAALAQYYAEFAELWVPVVPGPENQERARAVERYILRNSRPDRPFWHVDGS